MSPGVERPGWAVICLTWPPSTTGACCRGSAGHPAATPPRRANLQAQRASHVTEPGVLPGCETTQRWKAPDPGLLCCLSGPRQHRVRLQLASSYGLRAPSCGPGRDRNPASISDTMPHRRRSRRCYAKSSSLLQMIRSV